MKIIHNTFKYRLKPNKAQRVLLDKHFGCTRFVYNHFLSERKVAYEGTKSSLSYKEQQTSLKIIKQDNDKQWLKEINSQSLQYAVRCVDTAYKNFFKGNTKHPRFKSRRNKNSFHVPQNINIIDDKHNLLSIPKFKNGIKMIVDRPV